MASPPRDDSATSGGSRHPPHAEAEGPPQATVAKRPATSGSTSKRPEGGYPGSQPSSAAADSGAVGPSTPVPLASERDLATEIESIAATLSSLVPEWTERVSAMARLEGIATGNPGMIDLFNDLFKSTGMRASMTKQVRSRRRDPLPGEVSCCCCFRCRSPTEHLTGPLCP